LKGIDAVIKTGRKWVFRSKAVLGANEDGGGVLDEVAAEILKLRQRRTLLTPLNITEPRWKNEWDIRWNATYGLHNRHHQLPSRRYAD
jgi:hypothetical protein